MDYESKSIITSISASSKVSINLNNKYYTVEYGEFRSIPDVEDVDISKERKYLWDTVNEEVDNQIIEIIKTFGK